MLNDDWVSRSGRPGFRSWSANRLARSLPFIQYLMFEHCERTRLLQSTLSAYCPPVSAPSHDSCHQDDSEGSEIEATCENDQPCVITSVRFENRASSWNTNQGRETCDRKCCSVPFPIVLDLADCTNANGGQRDSSSRPKAKYDRKCSDSCLILARCEPQGKDDRGTCQRTC